MKIYLHSKVDTHRNSWAGCICTIARRREGSQRPATTISPVVKTEFSQMNTAVCRNIYEVLSWKTAFQKHVADKFFNRK